MATLNRQLCTQAMAHLTALTAIHTRRYARYYGKSFAVPLALRSRTHLSVHRIEAAVDQAALRHSEDATLSLGGGEDRYSGGGPSEGAALMLAASHLRRRGQA